MIILLLMNVLSSSSIQAPIVPVDNDRNCQAHLLVLGFLVRQQRHSDRDFRVDLVCLVDPAHHCLHLYRQDQRFRVHQVIPVVQVDQVGLVDCVLRELEYPVRRVVLVVLDFQVVRVVQLVQVDPWDQAIHRFHLIQHCQEHRRYLGHRVVQRDLVLLRMGIVEELAIVDLGFQHRGLVDLVVHLNRLVLHLCPGLLVVHQLQVVLVDKCSIVLRLDVSHAIAHRVHPHFHHHHSVPYRPSLSTYHANVPYNIRLHRRRLLVVFEHNETPLEM
jgi:hypothetical protein